MQKVKVWDLATRLYHWIQALVFAGLVFTGFSNQGPHIQLGLVLFTLLLWRVIWGFIGSESSRFRSFLKHPKTVVRYAFGKAISYVGHNPLGAVMVVAMIGTLLIQCVTGMLLAGIFDGLESIGIFIPEPLYDIADTIHVVFADMLPIMVALHVGAIVIYKLRGKSLLMSMFTGQQALNADVQSPTLSSNFKALLVLIISILVTMTIVAFSMV
ncbi:cytochrome b/b6 domain-containing protein [Vibrio barjaei]|uniref:Cytochrome b/b6 domain-containing protein n=1 Tax=Vibrio barjaei TaxID=1676683 RepID=A0ABW7IMT4_9VIBR